MVADDIPKDRAVHGAFHLAQVIEALISFGVLRPLGSRQQRVELHSDQNSVQHQVLGVTGVDTPAGDLYFGRGGVEALVLDLAELAPVDGVGLARAEKLRVEVVGAAADLFVRREGDADGPVRELRMRGVVGEQVHDLRDAGLVIGAEQGPAVRYDQVLADMAGQFREIVVAHDDGLGAAVPLEEHDAVALIVLFDPGIHVRAACRGRRVHVRDETEGRLFTGERRVYITVFAVVVRLHAHLCQLAVEDLGQVVLLGGRGRRAGVLGGLGVYLDISEKPVDQVLVLDHWCLLMKDYCGE